ncbi:MAG: hypothetical protein GOV01_03165 [Candidatus Altiarchaeota archaeon]|nr:hypothetical protein [Candidatus Altiarchaeota archaeon]
MALHWISQDRFLELVEKIFGLLVIIPGDDEDESKKITRSMEKLLRKVSEQLQGDTNYAFSLDLNGKVDESTIPVYFMKEFDYWDESSCVGLVRIVPIGHPDNPILSEREPEAMGSKLFGEQGVARIKHLTWLVWNAKLASSGDESAQEKIDMSNEELGNSSDSL